MIYEIFDNWTTLLDAIGEMVLFTIILLTIMFTIIMY